MQYDIFISYKRRGTSSATAAYLYDLLVKKGYNVFFDRKEMRNGSFNKQLYNHIENVKDIFILLEEGSLGSCFSEMKDAYKTDWFCMEIMHALEVRGRSSANEEEKLPHIIPLLLDGYVMPEADQLPDEMKELPMQNAIPLDISEIDDFYKKWLIEKKYLASKPRNLYLSQMEGDGLADFLFYANGDCDIFEFGNLIGSINQNIDEEHPLKLPVKRSGEHRFRCRNNDTCEEQTIKETIGNGDQKYVSISWTQQLGLWDLTDDDINREKDSRKLYNWGKGLYDGTSKHEPNIAMSFKCLKKSASLWNIDARDFITSHVRGLDVKGLQTKECIPWYEVAAEYGSADANELLGRCYDEGIGVARNYDKAFEYGKRALDMRIDLYGENNADVAMSYHNLGRVYSGLKKGDESIECYKKALNIRVSLFGECNVEVAKTMGNLAIQYKMAGKFEESLNWHQKAYAIKEKLLGLDDKSTAISMLNMGDLYVAMEDYNKAYELYLASAKTGLKNGVAHVGLCYHKGYGVEKDLEKAIEWYEKSAFPWSYGQIFLIGCEYEQIGASDKAFECCRKSAEYGNVSAISRLARYYKEGCYVEKNICRTIELYNKAYEKGDLSAMAILACLYRKGEEVEMNIEKADKLEAELKEACKTKRNFNSVAWNLHLCGFYSEALPWAEKAVEGENTPGFILDTLACVYQDLQRYEDAMSEFELCLKKYQEEKNKDGIDKTESKIAELKKIMNNE